MIVLPNYDDQIYEDIVETARRKIPVVYPEWTDLNEHDPGITLIELFAWLKEMEQYQLNRIPNKGYESMLKLLGVNLKGPNPSKTVAFFRNLSQFISLFKGHRFATVGGAAFECFESFELGKYQIVSVSISNGSEFFNVDDILKENDLNFNAFGEKPVEKVSSLYIGINRRSDDRDLSIYLLMYDNYPVKRNPFLDCEAEPRHIIIEYAVSSENGTLFRPVELLEDETHALSVSGTIRFRVGDDMTRLKIRDDMPDCCWIRFRLIDKGCEELPKLISIFEDAVPISQCHTICETVDITVPKAPSFDFIPVTFLGQNGELMVFIREKQGWTIFDGFLISPQYTPDGSRTINLKNIPDSIAMDGMENVRLICYESDSRHLLLLNGSNGMPKQRFLLDCNDIVFPDKLRLMVREQSCSGEPHWYDWNYTNDYAKAGPVDRVFGYDNARHEIVFGDNVNGAVPKAGENNILIVSCVMTQGSHGNILANSLEKIQFGNIKLSPCNLFPSGGGYDGDNVQSAVETFRTDLKRCTKAVTASDYEEITYNTPGLRVLGVKAIPYYDPDTKFTGDGKAAATVTIVVMPYNESQFPKPDEKFLQVVRRNLEQYRLITTNVKVIAPSYIRVSIYAEVVLQNISDGRIISEIRTKIERLFDIQKRISMGIKPSFGESVRENTMISKIAEVSGVNHVKKVTLSVKSTEGYRDKYGNIQLPPYAIAYLGDFEIRPIDLI